MYLSLSPLLFISLLFSGICKVSSDNHFAFLHFFFLGIVLVITFTQCYKHPPPHSSSVQFSSVAQSSVMSDSATPWTASCQPSLSITNSWSLLKLMSIESVMPSNHLILCCPLLLLPSIFPSIRVFSNESALCIRWPKYWSFSLNISPSNELQDWFPLGWTCWISLHSRAFSNTTVQKHQFLQCSAFFMVQLSHPYNGKTIALSRWTFVGKDLSLPLNMLSRLVITFLPRSKHLFISWLQSLSAVIGAPPPQSPNKVCHCFHCFSIYLPWSDGTGCHDLIFLNVEL